MKECKAPSAQAVKWKVRQMGVLYMHEQDSSVEMSEKRLKGLVVEAQTFHKARQLASIELRLAPEHIFVEAM